MKSDRIRHERVEDEDEKMMDGSYTLVLDELEQQNHRMVDKLVEKGYALAQLGKRNVQRITARQIEGRAAVRTEPTLHHEVGTRGRALCRSLIHS